MNPENPEYGAKNCYRSTNVTQHDRKSKESFKNPHKSLTILQKKQHLERDPTKSCLIPQKILNIVTK